MVRYPLLEATNKQWVVVLELAATGALLLGIVVNFVFAAWRPNLLGLGFGVGLAAFFAMSAFASYAFYNFVKCPSCGNKLNRFKNGKKVPSKQAYTQLKAGHCCRHCGWQPAVNA